MPSIPQVPLPATKRILVTVPVVVRADNKATLGEVRRKLLIAGCKVGVRDGAFHSRGSSEVLDDDTPIGELPDTRLIFFPETDLKPWEVCAAHRATHQLVQARAFGRAGPASIEAAARHPFYKTRHCNSWLQSGQCVHGARCVFAHGPSDLRSRPQFPLALMQQSMASRGPQKPAEPVKEVIFTVDKEEERRRAERAKRFAPRVASFEVEEAAAKAEEAAAAATEVVNEGYDDFDDFAALSMDAGWNEEHIADYLLEMQQDFLNSFMPPELEEEPGEATNE